MILRRSLLEEAAGQGVLSARAGRAPPRNIVSRIKAEEPILDLASEVTACPSYFAILCVCPTAGEPALVQSEGGTP